MTRVLISRLIQFPVIMAVIFLVTFTMAWIVPGNPLENAEGRRPPPEIAAAMARQYHLDSSTGFLVNYLKGLTLGSQEHRANYDTSSVGAAVSSYFRLLIEGSNGYRPPYFGPSLQHRDLTVNAIIGQGLPVSMMLGTAAIIVALIIGLMAGIIGALKPGSPLDLASLIVALVGVSLPSFVIGSVLLVVFVGMWQLAPVGGWEWPGWEIWTPYWWQDTAEMLRKLILPAITLGLAPAAYIARLIRLGLADVMSSDFIRTARAKGLSTHEALFRHALKVAFLPVLSFLGPAAAAAMTGSFVVEKVFNIPGLGKDFVFAVLNKDQFLILGLVLTYSTILIIFNMLVDIAYAWVDPRIEL